ncbi:SAUR-like auxin-responsive protein family [Striga hermonthica]|uniref:SAUR-like auxin-responsive protein family n=1 Tax=Striga hermonthica TaxID=68872 RepID=A0A9N7NER7_STRHE|nr:SAUR-like auxin-responsive protein family [Striga hermonthica]
MAQDKKSSSNNSLKLFIKRLQNYLRLSRKPHVPNGVKKGHFTILVKNENGRPTRLVVGLCTLKHPGFLRLLEMAEEEYGLGQRGALVVPCGPDEVRRILEEK